jgi:hypothetical protein
MQRQVARHPKAEAVATDKAAGEVDVFPSMEIGGADDMVDRRVDFRERRRWAARLNSVAANARPTTAARTCNTQPIRSSPAKKSKTRAQTASGRNQTPTTTANSSSRTRQR